MGSNIPPNGQVALSTRQNNKGASLILDISKHTIIKTNIKKYKIGNINILNFSNPPPLHLFNIPPNAPPAPTPPPSHPKPSNTPPTHPAKSPAPTPATDRAAARLLQGLSNHISAAETLLTLYTFGPPTAADSCLVFNSFRSHEDTEMVNLYCHGTNLHLQKSQDQAQAYLRSLSPAGREGLVLLPADVRRDGRLFPEELHGKIDCRRCAVVRAAGSGCGGCDGETEDEEVAVVAEVVAAPSCIKQSPIARKRKCAVRVVKVPRKRVRIAETKVEDGDGVSALGLGAVVGARVTRSRRSVKVPMRFGS